MLSNRASVSPRFGERMPVRQHLLADQWLQRLEPLDHRDRVGGEVRIVLAPQPHPLGHRRRQVDDAAPAASPRTAPPGSAARRSSCSRLRARPAGRGSKPRSRLEQCRVEQLLARLRVARECRRAASPGARRAPRGRAPGGPAAPARRAARVLPQPVGPHSTWYSNVRGRRGEARRAPTAGRPSSRRAARRRRSRWCAGCRPRAGCACRRESSRRGSGRAARSFEISGLICAAMLRSEYSTPMR